MLANLDFLFDLEIQKTEYNLCIDVPQDVVVVGKPDDVVKDDIIIKAKEKVQDDRLLDMIRTIDDPDATIAEIVNILEKDETRKIDETIIEMIEEAIQEEIENPEPKAIDEPIDEPVENEPVENEPIDEPVENEPIDEPVENEPIDEAMDLDEVLNVIQTPVDKESSDLTLHTLPITDDGPIEIDAIEPSIQNELYRTKTNYVEFNHGGIEISVLFVSRPEKNLEIWCKGKDLFRYFKFNYQNIQQTAAFLPQRWKRRLSDLNVNSYGFLKHNTLMINANAIPAIIAKLQQRKDNIFAEVYRKQLRPFFNLTHSRSGKIFQD